MTDLQQAGPFAAAGEVAALCRARDWSTTPLGPVEQWPDALSSAVRTCLESPFPINLWCGDELVLIYNDAYRTVLGNKHPAALGRPGQEVWSEIWDDIRPMFERIRAGGPAAYAEDAPFVIRRAGDDRSAGDREPNAWFTFALSPVRDDRGEIVAMLNIVSESTGRVLLEREIRGARAAAERAEARLREVFTQAPAFMAVVRGPEHVFEYVNSSYYQLTGNRDLIGLPVREALPEIREQGFEELLNEVLATGVPYVGREIPVLIARSPDTEPEQRFLDFVYYPITEADGTRTGVVAHGSD
ncbi:MAG TPA: PAS domain-containing protein, partial [Longimicrobiales bacterium]|nr:PAS domain-containing protein [Longimicrobiales bacterium]